MQSACAKGRRVDTVSSREAPIVFGAANNAENGGVMGEKTVEFQTSLTVQECGLRFKSGIESGRGASAWIGGVTAKVMGGETLSWYTPQDNSPFASLNNDRPSFCVGVGVPKANGAHTNGTNVEMYVWDRGGHRDVMLWAHHSLTGGSHATKLMAAARAAIDG
jgi:hypothetical protein